MRVKPRRRRGRGLARAAFVLVGLAVVGAVGLAYWFGFIPNPASERAARALDRAADSALAAAEATALGDGPAAEALDSALAADTLPVATGEVVTVADSTAGDIVYHGVAKCAACHGTFGEGVPGSGPSLRDTVRSAGDGSLASIRRIIDGGAPASNRYRIAMPAYGGQLLPEDVARVAAFVYALSHPGNVVDDPLPPADSSAAGAAAMASGAANADVASGAPR